MTTFVCTSDERHCCHRKQAEETALPPVRSEPLLADQLAAAAACVGALRFALRHIDHHEALMKARKALDVAEQTGIGSTANTRMSNQSQPAQGGESCSVPE